MSKICPNCLRPVRTGTNYCGYCGTSLVPTPRDPAPTMRASSKEAIFGLHNESSKKQRVPKSGRSGRSWTKAPITLLVIVLLLALTIRFWPEIVTFLGQAVILLKLS